MYRLENNVEWTEELKTAFREGTTYGKIVLTENGVDRTIDQDNGLMKFTIKELRFVPDNRCNRWGGSKTSRVRACGSRWRRPYQFRK